MGTQENINWNLIHRYLSGECTHEEEREVQAWLKEDTTHREFLKAFKKVWEVTPGYDVAVDLDEELRCISERLGIETDKSHTHRYSSVSPKMRSVYHHREDNNVVRQLLRIAVIILLIAAPTFYLVDFGNPSNVNSSEVERAMQKIQTAEGERAKVDFSDGSRVMLNSMSTLQFPRVFEGDRREIFLEGEAYFSISHKDDLPFIIHTGKASVKVLGTEFNVNAYDDEEFVEVVVKEGKVAVSNKEPASGHGRDNIIHEVILVKGQRTHVRAGHLPSQPQHVALTPHLGWVNGQIIFDGTPLSTVLRQLKRTYELNFEVTDSTLLSKRLKASFKRERPEKVVALIAFSLEIGYELREDTVIFKPNQKKWNTQ